MATYYVSTTGNNGNAGTLANPWKSLTYSFNQLSAGDQLYMRGGTYTISYSSSIGVRVSNRNGTAGNLIKINNYPGETPIYDGSGHSGSSEMIGVLMINCDYWHITGLKVQNVRGTNFSKGVEIQDGCSNIILEQIIITLCGGGFTFGGSTRFDNILYKNCDAFNNWDVIDNGGYCNGFNGNLPVGSTITYEGCRAWLNSDDGWDFYAGGGYATLINCWAFSNGHTSIAGSTSGDGDGFKLGYTNKGDEAGNQRTLYNCLSFENDLMGFDESMDITTSQDMALYNCIAYNNANLYSGFRFNKTAGTGVATLRNCVAIVPGGTLAYSGRARNVEDHNSWDGAVTASAADFESVSSVGADGARQADGSLPVLTFLKLKAGSDLIGAGNNTGIYATDAVGNTWNAPPSMGAYEYGGTPPVPPANVPVTKVTVVGAGNKTVITINAGTLQMSAIIEPNNATDKTVVWSVINGTGTARISTTGLLMAKTNGTVTVKAVSNG